MDWEKFWQEYPIRKSDLDPFEQVGKTKEGKSITQEQLSIIINDIINKLELSKEDILLDLCCGNGVITKLLSNNVKKIIGIDFSKSLIEDANKYYMTDNIEYYQHDVKRLDEMKDKLRNVSKVLCYEALAFFNEKEFSSLLNTLNTNVGEHSIYFFGSVLDNAKKFNFFNTLPYKFVYLKIKITGKDFGLGKWWKMSSIKSICNHHGLKVSFYSQNQKLHTEHFRTDVLISK